MDSRRSSRGHLVAAFVFFGLITFIAIILLLTALVVWLSILTDSVIVATTLIGGFFAVLAFVIYLLVIRDAIEHLCEKFDTIFEVAQVMHVGYKWLTEKILLLFK
ncbi:MAG: hypothetical protein RR960_06225 [Alistipes sp.]